MSSHRLLEVAPEVAPERSVHDHLAIIVDFHNLFNLHHVEFLELVHPDKHIVHHVDHVEFLELVHHDKHIVHHVERDNDDVFFCLPDPGPGTMIEIFAASPPIFSSDLLVNYTLTLRTLGGTSTSPMTISSSGPPGLTLTFVPTQVTVTPDSGPVDVTVSGQTTASMAPGTYPLNVTLTGDGGFYTETQSVQVVKYLVVTVGTSFLPQNYTVPAGSTVTWLRLNGVIDQYDKGTHNVHFVGPNIPVSPDLAQFDTYSYTFANAGTYLYYCDYHQFTKAIITVTA